MADVGIKINAFDNTKTAFDSVGRNLGGIQATAATVGDALASIGVGISVGGFVAMTKAIVDGLDAMNDLRDATGASIENISALEDVARRSGASFDTVSTALVKLNQGLNSAKPGSDTENAIKAIGLSVKDLKALDPAEAFQQIAVKLAEFADDGNKARLTQELFGKSLKEVAPLLKDLAESGKLNATVTTEQAAAAEKLNKQMFYLQKSALDMGRAFTSSVIPALADGVERFMLAHKHAGSLLGVLQMYAGLNYGKNVQGNLGEIEQKIAGLEQRATRITSASAMRGNDAMIADLRAQAAYLKELRQLKILAEQGDNSDAVSRRYMQPKASVGEFAKPPKTPGVAKESGNAFAAEQDAAKEWAKAYEAAGKASEELTAKTLGLTKAEAELKSYMDSNAATINDKTNPAMRDMLKAKLEANVAAEADLKLKDATEKADKAAFEARLKYKASLGDGLDKIRQEVTAQQEYNDQLGLSKDAIAELNSRKLETQADTLDLIAIKKLDRDLDEEQYDLYKAQAKALRERANAMRVGGQKEAAIETAKAAADEWKRGWQETDNIARDVFTSWATNGGSAAKIIGDTLKKALLSAVYEATIKPLVFNVYASLTGGAPGTAGGAAGAIGNIGTIGNAVGGMSGLVGATNAFALSGAGAALGLSTPVALAVPSAAAGYSASAVIGAEAAVQAGSLTAAGATASSFAAGAAAAGPYIVAALVAAELMKYKVESKGNGITATIGGSTGLPSGSVGTFNEFEQTGGLFGGGTTTNRDWGVADQRVADYIGLNVQAITAANREYGKSLGLTSTAIDGFTKNIEVNLTGLDAAGQKAAIDAELAKFAADQSAAAYTDAVSAFARDGETTAATVARLSTDLAGVNSAFGALGYTLMDVSVAGAAAASGLASAFGSLAAMQSQTAALYNNYYTQAEQKAYTVSSVAANLGAAGITGFTKDDIANASREQIRAVVDQYAGKVGTATGDKQYAAIVAAANALTAYVPAFADAAKAVAAPAAPAGSTGGGGGGGAPVQDAALTAWQEATAAIVQTMGDLRTALVGEGVNSFAKLQAQFAIEVAQAKAGDVGAAQDLPALAKSLADANKAQATSSVQQAVFTARIVETLGAVAGIASVGRNISVPAFASGGLHAGGWALVGEQGPELVNMPTARIYTAQDTRAMLGGQDTEALLQAVAELKAELAAIKAYTGSSASSGKKMAQVLDGAANGQNPLAIEAV